MSTREINFLQRRHKVLNTRQRRDLKYLRLAGTLAAGAAVLLTAMVGVRLILSFQSNRLVERQQQLRTSIEARADIEESVFTVARKLQVLVELFERRADKQLVVEYFSGIFGPEVLLNSIDYDIDNNIVSLGVTAESIFVLEEVFEVLESDQVRELFGLVRKSDIRRNQSGAYDLTFTITLGKPANTAAL